MLLIRELARVIANVVHFGLQTRRPIVLLLVLAVAIAAIVTTSVTVIGPIALYPFL